LDRSPFQCKCGTRTHELQAPTLSRRPRSLDCYARATWPDVNAKPLRIRAGVLLLRCKASVMKLASCLPSFRTVRLDKSFRTTQALFPQGSCGKQILLYYYYSRRLPGHRKVQISRRGPAYSPSPRCQIGADRAVSGVSPSKVVKQKTRASRPRSALVLCIKFCIL